MGPCYFYQSSSPGLHLGAGKMTQKHASGQKSMLQGCFCLCFESLRLAIDISCSISSVREIKGMDLVSGSLLFAICLPFMQTEGHVKGV